MGICILSANPSLLADSEASLSSEAFLLLSGRLMGLKGYGLPPELVCVPLHSPVTILVQAGIIAYASVILSCLKAFLAQRVISL